MRIEKCVFSSAGLDCAGTLYLPPTFERPPVVVMGHGLGAQQDFRLPDFARHFAACGLAVFTFDYCYWGESAGAPRHLLLPRRQLQDWQAAIAHVRTLGQVDGTRLAIWGSSFSGAHVMHVAALDHSISAVVAQVMAADTASVPQGVRFADMLQPLWLALEDTLRGLLGLQPLYIPLVGKPGEAAVMTTPECWDGYLGLVPEGSSWKNQVTARSLLLLPFYRAVKVADRVTAPTLLMAGVKDSLVAIDDIRALARRIPGVDLREFECNHFQPYYPPWFDTFVAQQAEFLMKMLRGAE